MEAVVAEGVAEISAVADALPAATERAQETLGSVAVGRSIEDLLKLDLDGIVIATPSAQHAEQAITALEGGCAVFCQKPLARTAAEARAVCDTARRHDRLLGVDLSYRFTSGMAAIRDLVERGELGRVFASELVFHNAYGPDKPWFYDPKQSGGGCLIDLGTHLVDLALWCLDWPEPVSAEARLCSGGAAVEDRRQVVEDYAAGMVRLAPQGVIQLACSWRAPAGCDARIEASFYGTNGGARFRNLNGSFYDFTAEHCLGDRTTRVLAEPPDSWSGRAILDWVARLSRSRSYDAGIERVIRVARVLDLLYEGAK
jgi:predicted dehydrogenase